MTNQTTETKHTSEPWLIQSHTMADKEFTVGPATLNYDDVDHDEQEANAKLIAAAPNMFTALEDLFKHCAMIHKYGGEISNAKEADAAIKSAHAALISATEGEH